MRFFPLILLLCFGCTVAKPVALRTAMSKAEPQSVNEPPPISIAVTNFNVSWPPSPDAGTLGYRLLWGPNKTGYADQYSGEMDFGIVTNATVTVPTGQRYYFAVVATNLVDLDSIPTDAISDPITVPLTFALYFPDPGNAIQSSRDTKRWAARAAVFNNGLYFVTETPGVRWEFYRVTQ